MPARAPASIDMLQTVMRSSIDSASIAGPRYSMTCPVPPDTPILPMIARMRSLAVTPSRSRAADFDRERLRPTLQQALRREHVADFGRADAEGEGAERAVRRRVTVAADDGLAGLRRAELGTDDVHDAALLAAEAEQLDAELAAVLFQLLAPGAPRIRP